MLQSKTLAPILALCLHLFLFLFLCSIESIFFSPRNSFIEIDLWIISLIFIGLHREMWTGILFAVISSLFFSAYSGIPYHSSILSFLGVLTVIHITKNRSFTLGASYFSICSFISIISFYVFYFTLSWILGDSAIHHPHLLQWIISALTSSALFVLIRPLLIGIDDFFRIQHPFGFGLK